MLAVPGGGVRLDLGLRDLPRERLDLPRGMPPGLGALGERRTIVWSLLWGAGAFVAYGLATAGWQLYVLIVLASFGGTLMIPALR